MKRIKYVSKFARDLSHDEIVALVQDAEAKNRGLDVTGILMTAGGLFLQVIEGPGEAIDALWRTIVADERHTDVLLLNVEVGVERRMFPDWGMRTFDLDAGNDERLAPLRETLTKLVERRRALQALTSELERAVWDELAPRTS